MIDLPVYAFEGIPPTLDLVPLAARRGLDHAGMRLSLAAWRSLPLEARTAIARAGACDAVDLVAIAESALAASPPATPTDRAEDAPAGAPPPALREALGARRPLADATWAALSALDRFALLHVHRRAIERADAAHLGEAYDGIVTARAAAALSTHLDARGAVHMVDVGAKAVTERRAVASGVVRMDRATAERLARSDTPKGDVLATARLAGIMAAKRTPDLIPLCHAVALTRVAVELSIEPEESRVRVTATTEARDRTGVEMEALVAVSAACLTIYDMLKSIDRAMVIEDVKLLEKDGGRSGRFVRSTEGG